MFENFVSCISELCNAEHISWAGNSPSRVEASHRNFTADPQAPEKPLSFTGCKNWQSLK